MRASTITSCRTIGFNHEIVTDYGVIPPISQRNGGEQTGYRAGVRTPARSCRGCGKPMVRRTKFGKCRPCLNADPEFRAQQAAACAAMARKHAPLRMEELRESGRRLYETYRNSPEAQANMRASRPIANQKISQARTGWCPPEYRERYFKMIKNHMRAVDARAEIERLIAEDRANAELAAGLAMLPSAVDYLRRYAPISRLADGTWRYGNAILTPAEVVARARTRGWSPDDMRRAA